MKTLPIPPRELLPTGDDARVPSGAGLLVVLAISLIFWGIIAAFLL